MVKKSYLLLSTLIFMSGCASTPPVSTKTAATPVAKQQVSQLQTVGMQVIQQGDKLTVIIPTDVYFEPMTTSVKEERKTNLREMATFIKKFANSYPNSVIKVTGYTDQVFSQQNQLNLSQSYASVISSYLFNAGINPQRIATQGRGSNEPIADQTLPSSAALNRRVVIQIN